MANSYLPSIKRAHLATYQTWENMRRRCRDVSKYPRHAGRGISVCARWETFTNFLADMGDKPPGKSIERVDNNGNYEPGNCRWADSTEQANNTRNNIHWTFDGKTLTMSEWARALGTTCNTLYMRRYHGWSIERTLSTKVKRVF